MSEFAVVMGFAVLPALAAFAGGGLAELFRVSARALSLALHLAAGIVLAVVGLELMPEVLNASAPWLPLLAFVAGGAAVAARRAAGHRHRSMQETNRSGRWTCSLDMPLLTTCT